MFLPTEKQFVQVKEWVWWYGLGKNVGQLFGGCDGFDIDDTRFEMFAKPVVLDGNTFERGVIFGGSEHAEHARSRHA